MLVSHSYILLASQHPVQVLLLLFRQQTPVLLSQRVLSACSKLSHLDGPVGLSDGSVVQTLVDPLAGLERNWAVSNILAIDLFHGFHVVGHLSNADEAKALALSGLLVPYHLAHLVRGVLLESARQNAFINLVP